MRVDETSASGAVVVKCPPLQSGDHLTRYEFERRYEAMPRVKNAELIEGIVYMPTPVSYANHAEPHGLIMGWLAAFCAATPGTHLADNATVRLDADNEVQPDALLRLDEALGGHSRVSKDDYIEGAPEFIFEVAASSATIDLRDKLRVYRRNGVLEYVVWQTFDKQIDWFQLIKDEYVPLKRDADGITRSQVFPGLNLNVTKLLEGDPSTPSAGQVLAEVLAELQKGLASADHAAFVERLKMLRKS